MSSGVSKLFQKKKAKAADPSAGGGVKASPKASISSSAGDGGDDEWLDSSAAAAPQVRVVTAGKRVDDLCAVQKEVNVAQDDIAMKIQIEENRRLLQEARLRQLEAEKAIAEEEAAKKAAKEQAEKTNQSRPEATVSGRAGASGLVAIDWAAKRAERLAKGGQAAVAPQEDFPALGPTPALKTSTLPKAPISPTAPVKEQEISVEIPPVSASIEPPAPPESSLDAEIASVVAASASKPDLPDPVSPEKLPTSGAAEVVSAHANTLSMEDNTNSSRAGASAEIGKKKKKSSYIDF